MHRPRLVVAVVACVFVFVLAEGTARYAEPGLSSAGAWPQGRIAEQFDAVSRASDRAPVDVVFAGSSMIQRGVDADLYARLTGRSSVNAALPASTNFMLEPWLEAVVIPMLRPRAVVIGVASRDFNDNGNGPDRALQILVSSPGYRSLVAGDWLTRVDRIASRHSALVRVRRSLRDPGNVARALAERRPPTPRRRCPPADAAAEEYKVDPTVQRYPRTVLNDYDAGGVQTHGLIDAIRLLERRGVDVVLVELAASRDYSRLHPNPRRDLARYRTALRRVVRTTGIPVIDAASGITDERFFRDPIHLNCAGSARLTRLLAERVPAALSRR